MDKWTLSHSPSFAVRARWKHTGLGNAFGRDKSHERSSHWQLSVVSAVGWLLAPLAQFACLYLWAPVRWSWNASSSGTLCSSSGTWSQLLLGEKHRSLRSGKIRKGLYVLGGKAWGLGHSTSTALLAWIPEHSCTKLLSTVTQQHAAPEPHLWTFYAAPPAQKLLPALLGLWAEKLWLCKDWMRKLGLSSSVSLLITIALLTWRMH